MSNARTLVAGKIAGDNPKFTVDAYPNEPKQVTNRSPYVDVYTARIAPTDGEANLRHDVEVHVYTAQRGTDAAEDQLETARDDVLLSLQRLPEFQWVQAERTTFMDGAYNGYRITGWISSLNDYRKIVQAEGA